MSVSFQVVILMKLDEQQTKNIESVSNVTLVSRVTPGARDWACIAHRDCASRTLQSHMRCIINEQLNQRLLALALTSTLACAHIHSLCSYLQAHTLDQVPVAYLSILSISYVKLTEEEEEEKKINSWMVWWPRIISFVNLVSFAR